MDKLDKKDIERVKDSLKNFIAKTAGCEDADELHRQALNMFGQEFADKPSLIKQAASAYNSNKSIYKLSNADTATTDFGLLRPNELYTDLIKQSYAHNVEKVASANFVVKFYKDEQPIEKVAKAPQEHVEQVQQDDMSQLAIENYMRDVMDDRERLLIKTATRRDICARESFDCYESFCQAMNSMTKEARAQVAKNIISVYPVDGQSLMDQYKKDNELCKIANFTPTKGSRVCPTGDIYTKAQDCMVANFAKQQAKDIFEKVASDTLQQYRHIPGLYKLHKAAAGTASVLSGTLLAEPVKEALFDKPISSDDATQKVVSTRLLNQLREIETQNVLVDMYSEPFIASYPADEIEAATEQAMNMLPADQRIHPRKHVALIKTWVADILGRGGNMSAADSDKIMTAARNLGTIRANEPSNLAKDLY